MKNEPRIIEVPGSRVVSAYGFGREPENQAGALLSEFIGLMGWSGDELKEHRLFGFNDPDPAAGSPEYGYDQWITVDEGYVLPETTSDGLSVKEFNGGLFAALRSAGIPNPDKWAGVTAWLNGSGYQYDGSRQWLEEIILSQVVIDQMLGTENVPSDPELWEFDLLAPVLAASVEV